MNAKLTFVFALIALGSSAQAIGLGRHFGKTQASSPASSISYQSYEPTKAVGSQLVDQQQAQSFYPAKGYSAQYEAAPAKGYSAQVEAAPARGYAAQVQAAPAKGYSALSQAPAVEATKGSFQRFEGATKTQEPIRQQSALRGSYQTQEYQAPAVQSSYSAKGYSAKGYSAQGYSAQVEAAPAKGYSAQVEAAPAKPFVQSQAPVESFASKSLGQSELRQESFAAKSLPAVQHQQVAAPAVQSVQTVQTTQQQHL